MGIKHHEHNHDLEERSEHLEEAAGEARPVDHAHHGMGGRANHAPGGHHDHTMGAGHDRHAGHSVAMFRDKFWLSLALTIPVVLLSDDVQVWVGYSVPPFPGDEYAAAVLGR